MSTFLVTGMGEKLKQARKALGLTQEQLAEKLDMKQSYYSLVEAGKAGITLSKAPVLFSDLGISEKWFYDMENKISDDLMFDSASNINTWEYQKEVLDELKGIEFYKSLMKEKDSRIENLSDLVATKDQLIKILYEKIELLECKKK